jgi:hypothetical protein
LFRQSRGGARRRARKRLFLCRTLNATAPNCDNLVCLPHSCRLYCGALRAKLFTARARRASVHTGPLHLRWRIHDSYRSTELTSQEDDAAAAGTAAGREQDDDGASRLQAARRARTGRCAQAVGGWGGGGLGPPAGPEKQTHDARPAERAAEDARADPAGGVRLPLAGKVARGEKRAGLRVESLSFGVHGLGFRPLFSSAECGTPGAPQRPQCL